MPARMGQAWDSLGPFTERHTMTTTTTHHMTTEHPAWCDPAHCITDPMDSSVIHRSRRRVRHAGAATVTATVVDDGEGRRVLLDVQSEDPLTVTDLAAIANELLNVRGLLNADPDSAEARTI